MHSHCNPLVGSVRGATMVVLTAAIQYVQLVVQVAPGQVLSRRDRREMTTLASALDLLAHGDVASLGDLLMPVQECGPHKHIRSSRDRHAARTDNNQRCLRSHLARIPGGRKDGTESKAGEGEFVSQLGIRSGVERDRSPASPRRPSSSHQRPSVTLTPASHANKDNFRERGTPRAGALLKPRRRSPTPRSTVPHFGKSDFSFGSKSANENKTIHLLRKKVLLTERCSRI